MDFLFVDVLCFSFSEGVCVDTLLGFLAELFNQDSIVEVTVFGLLVDVGLIGEDVLSILLSSTMMHSFQRTAITNRN